MSSSAPANTRHDRRSERARRVAAERAAQARRERRKRSSVITAVAVAVLAVAVGLGIAVQSSRNSSDPSAPVPRNSSDGSFLVGSTAAPVTVTIYEDFLCPACADAERRLGSTLDELVEDEAIRIDYRPIAILDRASSDRYSTRALNAAGCVIDRAPDSFRGFHDSLFAEQPAEGGPGLSDERLTQLATTAGASGAADCIADGTYEPWSRAVTDRASQDGVTSTPTILVNGTVLTQRTPEALRAAVEAAS